METLSEWADWLKNEYNELNKTNFSGAIDVLVVRQLDNGLKAMPFYVRFGKVDVLKPKNQLVSIHVNDEKKSIQMRLDEYGEAFFFQSDEPPSPDNNFSGVKYSNDAVSFHKRNSQPEKSLDYGEELGSDLKSRVPSSNQLAQLDLKNGINEIKYTAIVPKGEERSVIGYVFVWDHKEKIVITDIDGTITRSAFRGQILSFVGQDWFHKNVAELLDSIYKNGYKVIYLSARPFFLCDRTRNVLRSIKQESKSLPPGPIFVNPVGFLNAFQKEIIHKTPDEFKIKFLEGLKQMFTENPFYSGFGDTITDVNTYSSIGVKGSLIFIVNQLGHVNFNPNLKEQMSYKKLAELIGNLFPVRF